MESYKINDCNIYGVVSRELEEVGESLEKSILRESAEDGALIIQADNSKNGALLCEKYCALLEAILRTKEELTGCIERLNALSKNEN